jgi:hypothetical protein
MGASINRGFEDISDGAAPKDSFVGLDDVSRDTFEDGGVHTAAEFEFRKRMTQHGVPGVRISSTPAIPKPGRPQKALLQGRRALEVQAAIDGGALTDVGASKRSRTGAAIIEILQLL